MPDARASNELEPTIGPVTALAVEADRTRLLAGARVAPEPLAAQLESVSH